MFFCEKLKADEVIFKTLLGVTQSNFNELLQEVTPSVKQLQCQENCERENNQKRNLLCGDGSYHDPLLDSTVPTNDASFSSLPSHPQILVKFLQRMVKSLVEELSEE